MRRAVIFVLIAPLLLVATEACRRAPAANASQASAAPATAAATTPAEPNAFTGTVAETMDSGGYTYARLQAAGKEDVLTQGRGGGSGARLGRGRASAHLRSSFAATRDDSMMPRNGVGAELLLSQFRLQN